MRTKHVRRISTPGAALFVALLTLHPASAERGRGPSQPSGTVHTTRFPGMKVLQFAFGGDTHNPYLPHNFLDPNCVVYTGTHDNDTTRGWFASAPESERGYAQEYLGSTGERIAADLIRAALQSTARTAILPLQDVLDLGPQARMNVPGATHGNWSWRVRAEQLDPPHAQCLVQLTRIYGRSQTDQ